MISAEQLKEWRAEADTARHSALGEYVPKDEFFALLDEVERLRSQWFGAGSGIAAYNDFLCNTGRPASDDTRTAFYAGWNARGAN